MTDDELEREIQKRTRRAFLVAGVSAAAAYGGWRWLRSSTRVDGIEWPLRRALEANETLARAMFRSDRLSPQFRLSDVTRARANGHLGLVPAADPSWRLTVEGSTHPVSLSLDEIRAFPRHEMITELRCIEGWSTIVQWAGARLADVLLRFPPATDVGFVGMETPGRGYYIGLDLESALHPQTLLAYEMNGKPLDWHHGAPLRLAIPVKYGIKNIKRIGTIRYTSIRPADFWAERGYDWYAGH